MRLAVTALAAALALLSVAACSSSGGSSSQGGGSSPASTLAVGEFNPFTGPDAAFGPEMVAGCIPAIRLINAGGGVLGHQMRCVQEDTRGDPADAVPAAQKMMATETSLVGVLGPSSDEALATAPLLSTGHVPMFGDTGQAAFDHTTDAYFYRITPADDVKGYAMALWAHKAGYTRGAAVFGNEIPTGKAGEKLVLRTLMDSIVSVSACPQDLNPCNGFHPSPLMIRILEPSLGPS